MSAGFVKPFRGFLFFASAVFSCFVCANTASQPQGVINDTSAVAEQPQQITRVPKELSKIIYNGMPFNLAKDALLRGKWTFVTEVDWDHPESDFAEVGCEKDNPDVCRIVIGNDANKQYTIYLRRSGPNFYIDGERV